jgi:hypothetical protein
MEVISLARLTYRAEYAFAHESRRGMLCRWTKAILAYQAHNCLFGISIALCSKFSHRWNLSLDPASLFFASGQVPRVHYAQAGSLFDRRGDGEDEFLCHSPRGPSLYTIHTTTSKPLNKPPSLVYKKQHQPPSPVLTFPLLLTQNDKSGYPLRVINTIRSFETDKTFLLQVSIP